MGPSGLLLRGDERREEERKGGRGKKGEAFHK